MAFQLNGGFPIILSDCPWTYANPQDDDPARGGSTYDKMTQKDLCEMGPLVQQIAYKDSLLFSWACLPKLKEALEVMDAWGFPCVTTAFVWVKLNPTGSIIHVPPKDLLLTGGIYSGQGYYTNGNAEIVLLGKRGKPQRVRKDIKQIVIAPRSGHSRKPREVRDRIKELVGRNIPGVELFATERVPGWYPVGNAIDGRDIREVMQGLIRENER